ncbi:MAG TPA: Gfo/Idh/MocA family oxidoreductase [Pirellulales bacterium]|jgi:predicted dehydrogenase|nr:Gfo/Idh/MocA family oxidoreductase [Pirellulales bacterium]
MTASAAKLRIGLIGCGVVGRRHAEILRDDARVEIAVCCDPSLETAQRLRDDYAPAAAVESDAARALTERKLEAAIICSPTPAHHEHCCRAFELGLDVLCEKPLAGRREDIVDLITRSNRSGRLLAVSYQRRYRAPYATARRELTDRADWYGPLKQVHVYVCERWQQTIHGTWRDDPRVGSGYFGDAGSHQIDVVNFITGEGPSAVYAQSEQRGSRVEITTQVMARLTNGAGLFAHFVGDANHWREDIYFHCRDADLLLRNEKLYRAKENQVEEIVDLLPENSPDRAFVDALLDGTPIVSPPEIALPMHDWTEGVLQSCRAKRWVDL